jgi:hypothetical protein
MQISFKNGQRVWWRDTDGDNSGNRTITFGTHGRSQDTRDSSDEDITVGSSHKIIVTDDAGKNSEVYVCDLEPVYEGTFHRLWMRQRELRRDMEIAILHYLRQNGGRISLSDDDRNNCDFPVTTALCGRDGYDLVEITDAHVAPGSSTIYADGRVSGFMERGYRTSSDNFSDVLCFIQHVIFSNTSNPQ